MRIKQTISMVVLLLLTVGMAFAEVITDQQTDSKQSDLIPNGDVSYSGGEFSGTKPGLLSRLFSGSESLTFTPLAADEVSCSATSKKGAVYLVKTGGLAADGRVLRAGSVCAAGEYIRFYQCADQAGNGCKDLFKELWYKSSSEDLMYYQNYYTKSLPDFWGTYQCYSCAGSGSVSSFTCWDNVWRGEPGTKFSQMSGTCTNGCKDSTTTIESFSSSEISNLLCSEKKTIVSPGTPSPGETSLSTAELKGSFTNVLFVPTQVKAGEQYQISAVFTAENEGVYYLEAGTTEQALSIVSATGSKCDGDKHWAGEFVGLAAGESVTMEFNLDSWDTPGKRQAVIGAYSGCLDDSGERINVLGDYTIEFTKEQPVSSENVNQAAPPQLLKTSSATTGLLVVGIIITALGGIMLFVSLPLGVILALVGILMILFRSMISTLISFV